MQLIDHDSKNVNSFFSSHVSMLNVLMSVCALGITTLSLPVMAAPQEFCVTTSAGEVTCKRIISQSIKHQHLQRRFAGTWEFQNQSNNRWQMKVAWNRDANRYEGVLTKQGQLSQNVGFSINELVWTATIAPDLKQLNVQQKWRWGSNGVSTRSEWRSDTVDLRTSTADTIVYTTGLAARRVNTSIRIVPLPEG